MMYNIGAQNAVSPGTSKSRQIDSGKIDPGNAFYRFTGSNCPWIPLSDGMEALLQEPL
jgi:hypothetical protein